MKVKPPPSYPFTMAWFVFAVDKYNDEHTWPLHFYDVQPSHLYGVHVLSLYTVIGSEPDAQIYLDVLPEELLTWLTVHLNPKEN